MWLFFTLSTTLMWSFAELFYKKGARRDEKYAHLKIAVCVGAVMGLHALYTLLTKDIGFQAVNMIRYLPVSLCYILSMCLSFFGMRYLEESISDPIENTSGAICCALCVIFLKQRLSIPTVIAIVLIVAGVLGIGFLEGNGETNRSKKLGKFLAVVAFAMPFCYALLDALGSFLDVYYLEDAARSPLAGVTAENVEEVANTAYELSFAACGLLIYLFLKIKRVPFELPKQGDKLLAASCETAGQFTYVYAMSGNGAVAAPILSSVCVFSVLMSRVFLKEKLTKLQYLFVALVIAGVLTLAVVEGD